MYFKTYDMSDTNADPQWIVTLYEIFKLTLNPDLTMREFSQYLYGCHPESLEISFIYTDQHELAGFCTAGAYPMKINDKKIVLFRSAFGLLDKYKNGKFPLHGLFYKYIRYKLKHPFTPVYVTGFMANPLMYAMICKYTHVCYPRRDRPVSEKMMRFKNEILKAMRLTRKETSPFVLNIHFQVQFKETDVHRFESSEDKDVKYFLSINPRYREKSGVLVLVPVTLFNMLFTFFRYRFRKLRKTLRSLFKTKIREDKGFKLTPR